MSSGSVVRARELEGGGEVLGVCWDRIVVEEGIAGRFGGKGWVFLRSERVERWARVRREKVVERIGLRDAERCVGGRAARAGSKAGLMLGWGRG